ncbi:MAG TPA: signal peptidase I [Alphaproteobacteria bacterium]|nr:signal peptidase I [Alphaproteobacteria bacterium]
MTKKKSGTLWETVKTVVYAVLIAFVIRTVAYEPFNIPSGSMIPTLLIGDYLFVSKFSYGYSRYSLPLGLPLLSGRIFFTSPKRGDVVVFKLPRDPKIDYIKRVIGLPGDRIQVVRGVLHINGQPVKLERTQDYVANEDGFETRVPQLIETLPGGVQHPILKLTDEGPLNNTGEYVVPPDEYFMMGDNRDNSLDSRTTQVGYVPAENLVGRAQFLFFSTDGNASIWEVWKWPLAIRYGRLLEAIH